MSCISCHFKPLKPLTLRMDHAKLLDVLTSLPVSHAIFPCAVCFATSRPENHAICSFIDSSGYASGPIRICLFIDYIIKHYHSKQCIPEIGDIVKTSVKITFITLSQQTMYTRDQKYCKANWKNNVYNTITANNVYQR